MSQHTLSRRRLLAAVSSARTRAKLHHLLCYPMVLNYDSWTVWDSLAVCPTEAAVGR